MAIGFPTGGNVPAGTVSATSVQQPPAIADQKRRLQDQIARQQLAANTVPTAKPVAAPVLGAGPKPTPQGGGIAIPALPRFPTRGGGPQTPNRPMPMPTPREPASMSAPTPKAPITPAPAPTPVPTAAQPPLQATQAEPTFEDAWDLLAGKGKARQAARGASSAQDPRPVASPAELERADRKAEKDAERAAMKAERNPEKAAAEAAEEAERQAKRLAKQRKSRTGMGG